MLQRLSNLPVAMFSMIMGLAGFALAWHEAQNVTGFKSDISHWLSWFAFAMFALLLILYLIKLIKFKDRVVGEFANNQQVSFFATISVSFLLIGTCMLQVMPDFAYGLWLIGTLLHLTLTLVIINRWIYHTDNVLSLVTPVWFIPTVGNILVPIAGVKFAPVEFSWFFMSLGLLLWLIVFMMLLLRLFFDEPLPTPIIPTMFIMLAPPAAGFIAWMSFNLELDFFARFLYYNALFILLLLASRIVGFASLPFSAAWWSYSFPLAAMIIASFKMYDLSSINLMLWFAWGLLDILTLLIIFLLIRTVIGIIRGEIILQSDEKHHN